MYKILRSKLINNYIDITKQAEVKYLGHRYWGLCTGIIKSNAQEESQSVNTHIVIVIAIRRIRRTTQFWTCHPNCTDNSSRMNNLQSTRAQSFLGAKNISVKHNGVLYDGLTYMKLIWDWSFHVERQRRECRVPNNYILVWCMHERCMHVCTKERRHKRLFLLYWRAKCARPERVASVRHILTKHFGCDPIAGENSFWN